MASFDVKYFLEFPGGQGPPRKREIKSRVRDRLVELKMIASPIAVCPPVQPDVSLTVPVASPESPQGAGGSVGVDVKTIHPCKNVLRWLLNLKC